MIIPPIEFLSQIDIPDETTEYVVSIHGEVIPRRTFKSSLENALSEKLWDLEYVSLIVENFEKIIKKELKEESKVIQQFQKWVVDNCYVLPIGSTAAKKELNRHPVFKNYRKTIRKFLSAVNVAKPLTDQKIKKIAIVIPAGGQGEKVIADAIKAGLSSQDREIEIIWPRAEADLLYQFANMTNDDVWKQIWQQKNDHPFAIKCWEIRNALRNFLPNDTLGDLRKRIQELNPDFIISTYYDFPEHATFASCPMAIMQCDYDFSKKLYSIAEKTSKSRVKLWVPDKACIPSKFKHRIDAIGYPVRPEIQKVGMEKLDLFRKKWNIGEDEKVVMMQMGTQGVGGYLPKILTEILTYPKELPPLHFVVVASTNQALYEELNDLLTCFPRHDIHVQIHKKLDATQMNELYNMAALMIGKAGGVTTAEILATGLYAILITSWHKEEHNINYLISVGQGEKLDPQENIVPVLLNALNKPRKENEIIDWKERISILLQT